jgi:hypothetical protein
MGDCNPERYASCYDWQSAPKRRTASRPCYYKICLEDALEPRWTCWFEGLSFRVEGCETVLEGWVPDQPALFGLLGAVRDLGLTLLSVERVNIQK